MFESIWIDAAVALGVLHLLMLLAVRSTFRFAARCDPEPAPLEALPDEVSAVFRQKTPEIQKLGFELIGCYDCGSLASETQSFLAYFSNRQTNDFASISAMATPGKTASYVEFSARFPGGLILETNTNGILPLTPEGSGTRVFRFPDIRDPQTLWRIHQQLKERYAPGLWALGEVRGEEIQRPVRVIENYGPRHARIGYMRLALDGQSYRLTWKGALLMIWRGLWPVTILRRLIYRHAMLTELHSLEARAVTALEKA